MGKHQFRALSVWIGVLCAILFAAGLDRAEITNINCRFALFTVEIGQYGLGPFPTLYGKPYTDYPSSMLYLMYLASGCGRWINMLTLTLPTILAAVYTMLMTYAIGKCVSWKLGAYGVLLSLLAFEFLNVARAPGLDMFVAAATVTAFYLLFSADQGRSRWRLAAVPLCLVFGLAFRGPLGLVIPAAVVIAYFLARREWKRLLLWSGVCGVTALGAMAAFLGVVYWAGGQALLQCFFSDQVLSRFGSSQPPWYFFTNAVGSYAVTYFLALLVIALYIPVLVRRPRPADSTALTLLRGLAAWVLIVLIGMSIPGTKHLRYVTPVIPAMGLISAWIFLNFDRRPIFDRLKKWLLLACWVAPPLLLTGWLVTSLVFALWVPGLYLPFWTPVVVLALLTAVVVNFSRRMTLEHRELLLLCAMVACFGVVKIMMVDVLLQQRETARRAVRQIEALRAPDTEIVFYNFGPDGDEHKYLVNLPEEQRFIPRYIIVRTPKKTTEEDQGPGWREALVARIIAWFPADQPGAFAPPRPMFQITRDRSLLLSEPENVWFLTRQSQYDSLMAKPEFADRFEVLFAGEIGHQDCVLFHKKP